MDAEACVRQGALDIGVFGPRCGRLEGGGQAAEGIVAALVAALRDCQHG